MMWTDIFEDEEEQGKRRKNQVWRSHGAFWNMTPDRSATVQMTDATL
jgi:hypothetical protein